VLRLNALNDTYTHGRTSLDDGSARCNAQNSQKTNVYPPGGLINIVIYSMTHINTVWLPWTRDRAVETHRIHKRQISIPRRVK